MTRQPNWIKNIQKQIGLYIFAFALLLASFSTPLQVSKAQEPTPTVTGETPTPSATPKIVETETATPQEEAQQQPQEDESKSSGPLARILVTISANAKLAKVMERMTDYGNVIELDGLSKLGVFMIEVPAESVSEKIEELRNISGVLYVEPDYWAQAVDTFPNDPGFVNQYALISIRAPQGWDLSTGSSSITIAIIDSGVDLGHVDLVGKLTAGYNFVEPNSVPQDDYGHGTHVAGIAAASGNNGAGIAGVSWGARIMPVKVLNSSGGGSYSNVALGIVWAVDNGAQVINLSLGGVNPSAVLQSAITYADNNNVLITAASGNTGSAFVLYPARYSEVMAVGASNMSNQPASFSNYGAEVDIAAPGENIYSLWHGGLCPSSAANAFYCTQSGTSMSAPHVSGLAAILFGYLNNAAAVRSIIESTALDIGPAGWDLYSGAGLIQMDAALALAVPGNGGGSFNLPDLMKPLPGASSPTWTPSPLATIGTASPTQTLSPLRETATSTPTLTPLPEITPQSGNKLERLKIFLSPYFCGAALMILLGLWLYWRGNFFGRRKRKGHNKFVM